METTMASKYPFAKVFSFDIITHLYTPYMNIRINGLVYYKDMPLQDKGPYGKLSPYANLNHEIAGVWDAETQVLDIIGYY